MGNPDDWGASGALPGPFYRVLPASLPGGQLRAQLASDELAYAYRATATLSATLENLGDTDQTVTIQPVAGLVADPRTVTVPAHSTAVATYTLVVDGERTVRLAAASGATTQPLVVNLHLREPLLGISTDTPRLLADTAATPIFTATLGDAALGSAIAWTVQHDGTPILTTTTPLVAAGDYAVAQLTAPLPGQLAGSAYTVQAQVVSSTLAITQTLPVVPLVRFQLAALKAPVAVAATTPAAVEASFLTSGPSTAHLQMVVKQDGLVLASGPIVTATFGHVVEHALLPLTLPALRPNTAYTLVVSGTAQGVSGPPMMFQGALRDPLVIAPPNIRLARADVRPGQSLSVTIAPQSADPLLLPHPLTATLDTGWPAPVMVITPTLVDGTLRFAVPVPATVTPGSYRLTITSPDLVDWSARANWIVRSYQLGLAVAPAPARAGRPLDVRLQNTGGVPAIISATLAVRDDQSLVIQRLPISFTLDVDSQLTTTLQLPDQLRSGFYTLQLSGRDQFGPMRTLLSDRFPVAGLEVSMAAQTPRLSYTTTEGITPTVTITSTQPITAAWLRTRVLLPDSDGSVRVTTLAGSGGCLNGNSGPEGLGGIPCLASAAHLTTIPSSTAVLVTDDYAIQRYDLASRSLTLLAGKLGTSGYLDGVGAAARFSQLGSLRVNAAGTLAIIADGPTICQLDLQTGAVTTLAGNPTAANVVDGIGSAAHFMKAVQLVLTPDGTTALIADSHTLRSLNLTTLAVTTLAGVPSTRRETPIDGVGAEVRFGSFTNLALSADGTLLYLTEDEACQLRTFELATTTATTILGDYCRGRLTYDGIGPDASFDHLHGLAINAAGTLAYVVEEGENRKFRRIDLATLEVTTLAGPSLLGAARISVDGIGPDAGFNLSNDMTLTADGTKALIGETSGAVRQVELGSATVTVTTLLPSRSQGTTVGPGGFARLNTPFNIAMSADGRVAAIADTANNAIRRLDVLTNTLTTIAGDPLRPGYAAGTGRAAHFQRPEAITISSDGSFALVADTTNQVVRRVNMQTGATEVLAGAPGQRGYVNGIGSAARFTDPNAIAISSDASFAVVVDGQVGVGYRVRRLDLATSEVTLLAGNPNQVGGADGIGAQAEFFGPQNITISGDSSFALVADTQASTIRRLDIATGEVTTIAGAYRGFGSSDGIGEAARFDLPYGIGLTADGRYAYIADISNGLVRRLEVETGRVVTMAGSGYGKGLRDGVGRAVQFDELLGLAINPAGTLGLVVDARKNVVRRLDIRAPLGGDGVIRETWTPITGTGVLNLTVPFTDSVLGHSPQARGPLVLQAELFSREPGSVIQRDRRQPLAAASAGFSIEAAPLPVALTSAQSIYRADVPGYSADDALAQITVQGELRNTTAVAADLTVSMTRNGTPVLTQTFAAVPPQAIRRWTFADRTSSAGLLSYVATTALGSATLRVDSERPEVKAVVSARPDSLVLGQATELRAVLSNLNAVPGVVSLDFGARQETVTLTAGQTVTLTQVLTPTLAGSLTIPVTLTGDLARTSLVYLYVEDHSLTVTPQLNGTLRTTDTLVLDGPAALNLALANADQNWFDVVVDYTLNGPTTHTAQALVAVRNGAATLPIALTTLPTGRYTLTYALRDGDSQTPLGSGSTAWTLAMPRAAVDLALSSTALTDGQTMLTVALAAAADNDRPWDGELLLTGAVSATVTQLLAPAAAALYTTTLALADLAGPQLITATLLRGGAIMAQESLTINATPRVAPALTLLALSASPATAGAPVTLTATLDNPGPAGDALLHLVAFDHDTEQLVAVGSGRSTVTLTADVPATLLAGTYPAAVRLGATTVAADVLVGGPQITLTHSLDQLSYTPYATATWTISLTATGGAPQLYDLALRYGSTAFTETVLLVPGVPTAVRWPFNVGPVADRAAVILTNHPAGDAVRYSLAIDSRWVPVIEDDQAYLASDRPSYQAGETITLALHLTAPTHSAAIFGPNNLPGFQQAVLWTSLALTPTLPVVQGIFTVTVPLSATLPTGRYLFRYSFDGQQRTLPVDIHGVDAQVEQFVVTGPGDAGRAARPLAVTSAGVPVTLTAEIRLDQPVSDLVVRAVQVAPDGTVSRLLDSAPITRFVPAGLTPVTVTGVLSATAAGSYHLALLLMAGASQVQLGGRTIAVDVGRAHVSAVTTGHAIYTPGQPGVATVSVVGTGAATVRLTTSAGTLLAERSLVLTGFATVTTTLPTTNVGPELVLAMLTSADGRSSRGQVAYTVAAGFDTTAPLLSITTPRSASTVPYLGASPLISSDRPGHRDRHAPGGAGQRHAGAAHRRPVERAGARRAGAEPRSRRSPLMPPATARCPR